MKELLYGFTQEELFDLKSREKLREMSDNPVLRFQINSLTDRLERDEGDAEAIKERVLLAGESCMVQTDLLTSMKGVSVFIGIGIIGNIIEVGRFKDSKQCRSYLRSAPLWGDPANHEMKKVQYRYF